MLYETLLYEKKLVLILNFNGNALNNHEQYFVKE